MELDFAFMGGRSLSSQRRQDCISSSGAREEQVPVSGIP